MLSIRESEELEATVFEPRALDSDSDSPRSPSTPQTPLTPLSPHSLTHSTPEELDDFVLEPRPSRRGLINSWSPTVHVLLEQLRETTSRVAVGSGSADSRGDAFNDRIRMGVAEQMTSTTNNMLLLDIG